MQNARTVITRDMADRAEKIIVMDKAVNIELAVDTELTVPDYYKLYGEKVVNLDIPDGFNPTTGDFDKNILTNYGFIYDARFGAIIEKFTGKHINYALEEKKEFLLSLIV